MPSSTSSSLAKPSSSSPPSLGDPSGDKRTTILAIVLCVFGIIAIAIIMIWTYRFKPRPPLNSSLDQESDTTHLHGRRTRGARAPSAARIIPFGSEAPKFKHSPGQGMRIAQRGPDGAWNFSESTTSLVPKGVSDLDHSPSPISPTSSHWQLPSPIPPAKLSDSKKSDDWRLTLGLGGDDFDINPPPAYKQEYVGYLDHGKN